MISDFTKKIKNYFKLGNNNEKKSKNRTIQSLDKIEELKKDFFEENNNQNSNKNNKSINFLNQNLNTFSQNNCEENIKAIIEENSNLFLEINQLKKDIDVYNSRLDELNKEYNKLRQDLRDNLVKNVSIDNITIEKDLEDDFYTLEEEKYKLKLNHLLNKNNLLKEQNEKALKHNEQMKKLYKIYTGKIWKNSN